MNKKARVFIALAASAAILSLSGCGYQGGYRYSCQDPVNWGAKECMPPDCLALGLCTNDILGFDPLDPNANTSETTTQGETSNG
jgi:hypothetical protein